MRLITLLLSATLLMTTHLTTQAAEAETKEDVAVLPINATLAELAKQLNENKKVGVDTNKTLENTSALVDNDADLYLSGLLEGAILFQQKNYTLAIEQLEKTKKVADNLAPEQANTAPFRQLHLILAQSYVAINDYDKAFVEKKKYLLRLFEDTEAIDKEKIAVLENKYEIEQKNKANQLLEEQSRLKQLKISEALQRESQNERDFIVLMIVAITFILLLLRQLSIRRRLLWLAQIDSLTSLKNRATLFEEGVVLFEQAKSSVNSLSVIMVDIDHFKKVNDEYGHAVGDEILKRVAKLSKEVMRSRDVLARLGGEEFIALLPSASLEESKAIAVRLKDKIAQENFGSTQHPIHITSSIGVVEYLAGMENLDEIIRHADQAMYKAKALGRNQVVTSKELSDS